MTAGGRSSGCAWQAEDTEKGGRGGARSPQVQKDTTHNPGGTSGTVQPRPDIRSEEHTSELQSLMRISYAVFCLKKKKKTHIIEQRKQYHINLRPQYEHTRHQKPNNHTQHKQTRH